MFVKRTFLKTFGLLLVAALMLSMVPASKVEAAEFDEYWVSADGNCGGNSPCTTSIQTAIDAVNPGGTVYVGAGDYTVPGSTHLFQLADGKRLLGAGADVTILRGDGTREVISVSGDSVLDGFTITGGVGHTGNGGGMNINSGSPTISNCIFTGNTASNSGGAVYVSNASPLIENCTFENNSAGNSGGAVFFSPGAGALRFNAFLGNTANFGKELYSQYPAGGVDARYNWWGSESGPTVDLRDQINNAANVLYAPYCTDTSCDYPVANVTQGTYFTTIQSAIDDADADDIIQVGPGEYNLSATIIVNKPVTILGPGDGSALVQSTLFDVIPVFSIVSDDVTISGLKISHNNLLPFASEKEVDRALISIPAMGGISGVVISGNEIFVPEQSGPMSEWNGVGITADGNSVTELSVTGNTIYNIRNGVVVRYNNIADVSNNVIYNTKGGIMQYTNSIEDAANRSMAGNSWTDIHNEWDIVWNTAYFVPVYQQSVIALSEANNGAYVVDRRAVDATACANLTGNRSHIFADVMTGTTDLHPTNGNMNMPYANLQDAINAAVPGGTVYVAAGEYIEDISMPFPVNLIGTGAEAPVIKGTLTINHSGYSGSAATLIEGIAFVTKTDVSHDNIVLKGVEGITIKNCSFDGADKFMAGGARAIQMNSPVNNVLIENSTFTDGYYVTIQGNVNGLTVKDSIIENVKSGINLMGGGNLVVTDTDFSVVAQGVDNDTYGIRFASPSGSAPNLSVSGGSIQVDKAGLVAGADIYHSAIIIRGGATGDLIVDKVAIDGEVVNQSTTQLDASPNWWGSDAGPGAAQIAGDLTYSPWCANEACTEFAPDGDGLVVLDGTYHLDGGFVIDQPGLTILLKDGTRIENNSPCFIVNADDTRIETESIGGAVCVPTSGDHGIVVSDGVKNLEVLGLEIDGSDQDTGDGIHFAGGVENVWLVNNKIHNLDGVGVRFNAEPAGEVMIQGNLFMDNTGLGIDAGTYTVPAQYNAWGNVAGANDGDGASENVDWANWTHADLFLESSGTVYANQVVKDDEIVYEIYGDLANVQGVEFTLSFPDELAYKDGSFVNHVFDEGDIDDSAGELAIYGYQYSTTGPTSSVSIDDELIFSVTFTGEAFEKDLEIGFAAENFSFAHAAGDGGPTNHVYATELLGVDDLEVIALPQLSQYGLDLAFIAGIEQTFTVTLENPAEGGVFDSVLFNFRVADTSLEDIASFEYYVEATETWHAMPLSEDDDDVVGYYGPSAGFPLGAPYDATTLFKIVFKNTGDYDVVITLDDFDQNWELAKLESTVSVLGEFTVTGTVSMQGRTVRSGVPMTLTHQSVGYTPFEVFSGAGMTGNLEFSPVNGGGYLVTTNQARYLNLPETMARMIYVDDDFDLPSLHLFGGNAKWTDNVIDILDASTVGQDYGKQLNALALDADVNFDDRVNIQDLALVGGNFDLTSEAAYADWLPKAYNGAVMGQINTSETGVVSGTLTGDYELTVDAQIISSDGNISTFSGSVSGDINGDIAGTVSAMGIDTLYGVITNSDVGGPVRVFGIFAQSGVQGHFVGQIATGPERDPVTSVLITGPDSVDVGETINLGVMLNGDPTDDRPVRWAVYVNHRDYVDVNELTGEVTGKQAGTATVIVTILDDSSVSYATKSITVTAP